LAQQLVPPGEALSAARPGGGTLVVATELYPVGGHSRVVADLMRELPDATLVLTDLFGNYRKAPDHLNFVHDQQDRAPVLVLLQRTLWAKCQELARLVRKLAPSNIIYLQHHQDPVAFIGSLGYAPARKTLVHHCDHAPSLGGTLAGVAHADFSEELAAVCTQVLQRPVQLLPLHVADQGVKTFAPLQGQAWSVVTSGTHIKFARSGPVALQAIAHTVLSATEGHFFHIGPIAQDWVAEIHQYLGAQGLDPLRFEALGSVPSLWQTLQKLDAHLYLGSAPAGGGRAAIEAQGCAYPVAFYRSQVQESTTLKVDSVYASKALGWSDLGELRELLRAFALRQAEFAQAARALYESRYSATVFAAALRELAPLPS
jgi:hypothetical protein